MSAPSPEEIRRVHAYECSIAGHQFRILQVLGDFTPTGIRCEHCSEEWPMGGGGEQLREAVEALGGAVEALEMAELPKDPADLLKFKAAVRRAREATGRAVPGGVPRETEEG